MSTEHKRRVMLVGLGPTTRTALEGLVDEFEVVALIRDGTDEATEFAQRRGVTVLADVGPKAVQRAVDELDPDAVVVSSYNRILDAELVRRCPFVNVHYAPLPRGRGRATVNWAIINGDSEAAISIHRLEPELDAGGILFQAAVPIGSRSTVTSVYAALNELQRSNIAAAVTAAIDGHPGRPQDEGRATYLCSRVADDGEIDWRSTATDIDRLVRALQDPFPNAFTWLGLDRLEIVDAELVEDGGMWEGRIPGRVVNVDRSTGAVDVLTADGVLRVRSVRREGEVEVETASSVIRSVRSTLGLRSADLVRSLRAASQVERDRGPEST